MMRLPKSKCGLVLLSAVLLGGCTAVSGTAEMPENGDQPAVIQESESLDDSGEIAPEPDTSEPPLVTNRSDEQVLFFCRTAEDKLIALYDEGITIQYLFGPEEQPELVLDVPREAASTYQWQGIGRYENYSVSIPNQDTVYHVTWSRDRLDITQPIEAGVSVEIAGEHVTTVDCATDVIHNMIGVDLPPTQL